MSFYTTSSLHIWASERLQYYRPQKVTVGPMNQTLQNSLRKKYLGRGTSFSSSRETDAVSCGTGRTTSSLIAIWRRIALSHWRQAPSLLLLRPHNCRAAVLPHILPLPCTSNSLSRRAEGSLKASNSQVGAKFIPRLLPAISSDLEPPGWSCLRLTGRDGVRGRVEQDLYVWHLLQART